MRIIITIAVVLTMAVGTALAQCPGCPKAAGNASMSMPAQTGELSGLSLVGLAGDTVSLSEHIGVMPMVMLLAGTDAASGEAAEVVQAAVAAGEEQPMLVHVLAAGPKPARTFAESHALVGLVLIDQQRTALAAAKADSLPVVLFIGRSGTVVKVDAEISAATVTEGVKALAETEEKLVDPVCGMTVTKKTAAGSAVYQGKTYYFCSTTCKENFAKDPHKYLAD